MANVGIFVVIRVTERPQNIVIIAQVIPICPAVTGPKNQNIKGTIKEKFKYPERELTAYFHCKGKISLFHISFFFDLSFIISINIDEYFFLKKMNCPQIFIPAAAENSQSFPPIIIIIQEVILSCNDCEKRNLLIFSTSFIP